MILRTFILGLRGTNTLGCRRPLRPEASARARRACSGRQAAADVQASGRRRSSSMVSVASAVTRSSDDFAAW